ncbi:MAG TPA: hypothetical protein VG498_10800 [Terriglobales bacterium]|nr:hypothetical protein [Terriglobales bacterium]
MNSEFEAYVEAIASDMEEDLARPGGVRSGNHPQPSRSCEPPVLTKVGKCGERASLRSSMHGEAIAYHGLI